MSTHASYGGPPRRSTPARPLRLVAALVLALVALGGPAIAPSGGSPAAAAAQATTTVELVDQPTWVRPGEPYEVRILVAGAPADATIDMLVHDRLESRGAFRSTLEDDLGDVELEVAARPLATGVGGVTSIGFTPGAAGSRLSGTGVYPVEVRILSAADEVVGRLVTYLSFLWAKPPSYALPLEVAVLVDLAAEPTLQPDGNYALPDGVLDRAKERIQVLQGTPGVPLTLAPRPETLEGLFHGGPSTGATTDQLRELAADRPVFARPFVDVDLAALQHAGLIPEANAQADGGANIVRNRLGVEPTGGMWLSGPTFGAESAQLAVELGIDRAVVPPTAIDGGDGDGAPPAVPAAPVRLGEGGPLTMVSDPALAEHLTAGDGVVAAHRFLAELAITWLERPSDQRGVVVHLPPDAEIDPAVVSLALGALADGQAVDAVPVDQIFRDVPPLEDGPTTVAASPHEVDDALRPIAPALRSARARVAGVGALLDDPGLTASLQQSLLLSTGTDTLDADRPAYVARADAALGVVAGAVALPDEYRITLTSRSSTIPVKLTNLSDQDLSVRVELDSDQLEFPDGDVFTPVLAPSTTTRLEVPVRARTSGAFTLDVTVTSPDGTIVLDTSTFDVRSTAISGVGLVLSIGACLFLAVWWARHWRSARRSRHLMPAGPVGRGTESDPPPPPPPPASEAPYRPAHMARQRSRSG